jgi:hypothetical protein
MGLRATGVTMRVRLISSALASFVVLCAAASAQPGPWDRPAAEMARRIADVLGPASAQVAWANISSIPKDSVPAIRHLVESDLASDGVNVTASESANSIRITLSQDSRGGLWVAEIQQGTETRVAMVRVDIQPAKQPSIAQKIVLKRDAMFRASHLKWKSTAAGGRSSPQVLAAALLGGHLIVLTPSRIAVFNGSANEWSEADGADLGLTRAATRDPRGIVLPFAEGFQAWAPGVFCTGVTPQPANPGTGWSIQCHSSDDPWPLAQTAQDTWLKAFYNGARDYFTGVVTPASAVDLPPFYTAAVLPGRSSGPALLIGGVDGKVSLAEANELKPVAGTRDWGSDFAVVSAGCGASAEVIVSSSGQAPSDSLRAFEIAGQEASPVSEPLDLGGTAMALWLGPDGKWAMAIVRVPLEDGRRFEYEVDRVTANCD